jgi:hypothetical protein
MADESDGVSGRDQADNDGLGGNPLVNDAILEQLCNPMERTYEKSIRVVFQGNPREFIRKRHSEVHRFLGSKFGYESEVMKQIDGIGKGVRPGEWIVSFKSMPAVLKDMKSDIDDDVFVQDACKQYVPPARIKTVELTFRIDGLPLDCVREELYDRLKSLGFQLYSADQLRQLYDRETKVRTEVVLFRMRVNEDEVVKVVNLTGAHTIKLGKFGWRINVVCYGYCLKCKKDGHLMKDCPNKQPMKCFKCGETGHKKFNCPIVKEKRVNARCFSCSQTGHFSNECDIKWVHPDQISDHEPMAPTNEGVATLNEPHIDPVTPTTSNDELTKQINTAAGYFTGIQTSGKRSVSSTDFSPEELRQQKKCLDESELDDSTSSMNTMNNTLVFNGGIQGLFN